MSFEGTFQILCTNGHQWFKDAYSQASEACPTCGELPALRHLKDETNCEPVELVFEKTGEDKRPCPCCNGAGTRLEAVYRIPQDGERVPARQWDGQDKWNVVEPEAARRER